MKGLNYVLFLSVLLASCQSDDISDNQSHDDLHEQYALEHRSSGIDTYEDNIDEIEYRSNLEVSASMTNDIKSALHSMVNYVEWQEAIDSYGVLRWNWSYLNAHNQDFYYVTTPIFMEDRVTAFLRYYHYEDHYHFEFVSFNQLRTITNNFKEIPDEEKYIHYLSTFTRLQFLSNGIAKLEVNEFLKDYSINISEDGMEWS